MITAPATVKNITLIGVGLIGSSFALDLKHQGLVNQINGVDIDGNNLNDALKRGVIDRAFGHICVEAVNGTDLVVIAAPVAALSAICSGLSSLLSSRTVVMDVGSTKQSAIDAFSQYLPRHLSRCIATHPIAGSECSGTLAAQLGLFQDKKLIICPHGSEDADSLGLVESLWRLVGADIFYMDAPKHDEIFAVVSHLPHLLAYAYMHQTAVHSDGSAHFNFAASGFGDFTRIAASNPQVWTDICMTNKYNLLALIDGQQQQLVTLAKILQNGDAEALYRYFAVAKQVRDDWAAAQ